MSENWQCTFYLNFLNFKTDCFLSSVGIAEKSSLLLQIDVESLKDRYTLAEKLIFCDGLSERRNTFFSGVSGNLRLVNPPVVRYQLFTWKVRPNEGHYFIEAISVERKKQINFIAAAIYFRKYWKIEPLLKKFIEINEL